jgi:two-component system, chemotaxis family, sensor kinase CheA
MAEDELTARLLRTFVVELEEQVGVLNHGLLRLEQRAADAETLRTLFRAAHTVKGAARVVGVSLVEEACHALEAVFASVRAGERRLGDQDFSLLFGVLDALGEAGRCLRQGEPLDRSTLHVYLPRLRRLAAPAAHGGEGTAADPDRGEPGAAASAGAGGMPAVAAPAEGAAELLVRVRADRLDELLAAVGELIVATGRATESLGERSEDARRLDAATAGIYDVVHSLRLRPFGEICAGLPRAVRDVARQAGREVALVIEGEAVEADRKVMDALREPLLHLVRNAVDHGIEAPELRERLGKAATGTVRVAAELGGGRLFVTVSDDGAGLDEAALRAAFRRAGRPVPERSGELAEALLAGGISTRSEATAISGRGVGVDLVRSALERIGGDVDVRWRQGKGTTFVLQCPPTPATIRGLLFRLGGYVFALPTANVERLLRVAPGEVHRVEGRSMITHGGEPVALHSMAAVLGPPLDARPPEGSFTAMVVVSGPRRAALIVDEALEEAQIVIRPLAVDEDAVPAASGVALLPSGDIALVLAAAPLLTLASRSGTGIAPHAPSRPGALRRRVLVADDSITTRTLEQSVLESAGYAVTTAVNGEDAWRRLERDGADLLVADVEMPRMDGIALCRRVRASERFAELPIVLVTGLGSDQDRARGLEAGADAYIVKSSFDQATLLDTVQQLIGDE